MGQAIGKTQRIGSHSVQLVKQIAEGGFAFVYLVKESSTGRQYALKRIIIQDHEQISLIQYEINVMRQISSPEHPHIVKFYDSSIVERSSGHQIGEAYILMEYCSSHLVDIMNSRMHHRFAENEVLQIFHEICDAVSHLHAQDPPIAHRDLKVENVLFDSGKYKLCDFGSCTTRVVPAQGRTKSVISKLEEEIQKFTTLPYRPPEMVDLYREAEISEKVDIWALGCLLYKLMYYTTPFEESGALQILNVNYTIPSHPHYSEKLQDLIRFLLNPTPESRPDIWEVLSMISELRGLPPPNRRRSKKTTPVQQQQQLQVPPHSSQSQNISPVLGQAKPPPHPNSHPLSLSTSSEPSRPERQPQQQVNAAAKPLQSSNSQPSISPSNSPSLTVPSPNNPSTTPLNSPQARRMATPNPLSSSTPALLKPAPSTPNRRGRPSHSRSGSDDNSNSNNTIIVPPLNNNIVIIPPPPQQNVSNLNPPQPLNNQIRKVNVSTEAIDGMFSRERQLEQHVLTATGPDGFIDMVAVEWLITHTWSTQNSTRMLENITRRPLTETIVCLKSLVVTHRVLGAGHQRSLKDATPIAPLFQNLHIGWMKQLEKMQSQTPSSLNLAKVVAAYCLIVYKKIMFHHYNPLISGNMHIDTPHPVLVATATPENSGTIHASHMTVLQLLDILKDIVSMQPMLVSLQNNNNNNTNTPSSPPTQVDIAELLLVTVGNLLQEAFHAYALITYVLSIFVNKENTPDISDLASNANPNFLHDLIARYQTMFPIFFEFFVSMAQAFPTVVGWGSWAVCGLCGVPQLPKVTPNLNTYPPSISTPPPNTLQTYQHTHNATPHANSRVQTEADPSDLFGNDSSDPFWSTSSTSNAPPKSLSESFNVSPPSSPIRSNASPAPPLKDRRATLERLASSPTLLTLSTSDSLSPFDLQQGVPSTSQQQQQQQQQQKNSVLGGMLSPRMSAKSGGNVSLSSSDPPSPTHSPTILNIPFVSNPTPAPPTPYPAAIPIFINNNNIAHVINSSTNNGSKPHRRSISNTTEVLRKQQNQLDAAQDLLHQQLEYQKRMFIQMKDSSNFISIPEESFRNDKGAHPIALSGSDDGVKKPKKRSVTANDVHLNKSILSQLDWFE